MKDNESEEMYLETILILKNEKPFVRSVDIVERMNFAKSSVSFAVNKMAREGLLVIKDDGGIELTVAGRQKAEAVYEKHCILTELLVRLGVESESAEENACRIEHVISDDVFECMKAHLEKHRRPD